MKDIAQTIKKNIIDKQLEWVSKHYKSKDFQVGDIFSEGPKFKTMEVEKQLVKTICISIVIIRQHKHLSRLGVV